MINSINTMKSHKKIWDSIALFIIALVLTMPFYTAQALAIPSVQISKNSGEDNIPQYLNAESDTWTVEATIQNAPNGTVRPENVKIKIGNNEAPFSSCSDSALGAVCRYLSPLTNGVPEGVYTFQVLFNFLNDLGVADQASNADVIKADGSAPSINNLQVSQQRDGTVHLNFDVSDRIRQDAPAVGLKQIDIIDADSGATLRTITSFEPEQATFNFREQGGTEGKLISSVPLTGEGRKRVKIAAMDRLGHQSISVPVAFYADFVKPRILVDTLNFTSLGRFVGQFTASTDITVDIIETSRLNEGNVTLYAAQPGLNNKIAACEQDETQADLWHCTWSNVEVNPESSISLRVVATDKYGNTGEATKGLSFIQDTSAPQRVFYGSERVFGESSFVKNGKNRILLKVAKQGALMTKDNIRANLDAVGGGVSQEPVGCGYNAEGLFECYWEPVKTFSSTTAKIGLSKFQDTVGNEGDKSDVELKVDNAGPDVQTLEIYGNSFAGDKEYFQSNDEIKIKFKAVEQTSGIVVLVNENGLVDGAADRYPENIYTRGLGNGWRVYDQDEICTPINGTWDCELKTDPVRSGFVASARLQFKIQDTAGNDAKDSAPWSGTPPSMRSGSRGDYRFELLGLQNEENPNYWETPADQIKPLADFIDIETTPLARSRMSFDVTLTSDSDARVRKVELVDCVSDLPPEIKGRQVVWNNVYRDAPRSPAHVNLVLEFMPFDSKAYFQSQIESSPSFTKGYINHTCTFRIFSQLGSNAIEAPETQTASVMVPFAFTSLGAADENLDKKIKDAKEEVDSGFWGVIGTLEKVMKVLLYIARVVQLIVDFIILYGIYEKGFNAATLPMENNPITGPPTTTEKLTFCLGGNIGKQALSTTVQWLQVPLQVLTCKPVQCELSDGKCVEGSTLTAFSENRWYQGIFIPQVLNLYNSYATFLENSALEGKWVDGEAGGIVPPSASVYDNIYLSGASLCLPGIIHNLDKYRQIKCRYIYCLENEVPQGLATASACSELQDVLTCKYLVGPLFQILPIISVWDSFAKSVASLLTDPIALVSTTFIATCAGFCLNAAPGAALELSSTCVTGHFIIKIVGVIENTWGTFEDIYNEFTQGGLNYCDQVL